MNGNHHAGSGPTDAELDARLVDYGARWQAATATLERSDALDRYVAESRVPRRPHSTLVVAAVAASTVAHVMGVTYAAGTLTDPDPTPAASGTGAPTAPSEVPTLTSSPQASTSDGDGWVGGSPTPTPTDGSGPSVSFVSGTITGPTDVTVNVSGFKANDPVSVSVCPADRVPPSGPGECGLSKNDAAKLITIAQDGTGSATLTLDVGPLENRNPPAASCGPQHPCVVAAVNISNTGASASAPIDYGP